MCGVWWIPDELCLAQLPRCLQPIRQIRLLYTFGITIVCELTNSNFKLHLYQIHTAYCLDFCLIPFLRLDQPLIHLGMMEVRQRETVSVRQFRKHVIVPFIAALLVILKTQLCFVQFEVYTIAETVCTYRCSWRHQTTKNNCLNALLAYCQVQILSFTNITCCINHFCRWREWRFFSDDMVFPVTSEQQYCFFDGFSSSSMLQMRIVRRL